MSLERLYSHDTAARARTDGRQPSKGLRYAGSEGRGRPQEAEGVWMDSQHVSSGEHPKIIGPPSPENKLQTILEAVGKTVAAVEYGEVESRQGMHAAEAVVFHFSDGTALSIEIGSNARDLSATRELTPPDVHTDLRPFWTHRARPHD